MNLCLALHIPTLLDHTVKLAKCWRKYRYPLKHQKKTNWNSIVLSTMLAISKFKLYFWKLVYLIRLDLFFFTNIINGALVFLSHTFLCQIPIHSSRQRKHEPLSKPDLPYDQTRWQSLKKIDYFPFLQQAKRPSWFCSFVSFSPASQNRTVYVQGLISLDLPS